MPDAAAVVLPRTGDATRGGAACAGSTSILSFALVDMAAGKLELNLSHRQAAVTVEKMGDKLRVVGLAPVTGESNTTGGGGEQEKGKAREGKQVLHMYNSDRPA